MNSSIVLQEGVLIRRWFVIKSLTVKTNLMKNIVVSL